MTRIAIISTPRSGNTWVRSVLARALDLDQLTAHSLYDLPTELPHRLILQLHWYREPKFQSFLQANGFQTLVLARHPLDVLLSVLHFARGEAEVAYWLGGDAGLPADMGASEPMSKVFRVYSTGQGAANLLSVSYQWWQEPTAVTARYEDLVREPAKGFERLVAALGGGREHSLKEALSIDWLSVFQSLPNRHGWHGKLGLWRELITTDMALRIYFRHRRVFQRLGYSIPITLRARHAAERNWKRLA